MACSVARSIQSAALARPPDHSERGYASQKSQTICKACLENDPVTVSLVESRREHELQRSTHRPSRTTRARPTAPSREELVVSKRLVNWTISVSATCCRGRKQSENVTIP